MSECSKSKNKKGLIKCLEQHDGPSVYDELIEVLQDAIAAQKGIDLIIRCKPWS